MPTLCLVDKTCASLSLSTFYRRTRVLHPLPDSTMLPGATTILACLELAVETVPRTSQG